MTNIHTALHHILYLITLSVGYGLVVWCQYKIIKHMDCHGESIRESTRRIRAITPLLTSMGPAFILVLAMVIDYSPGVITVYLSVGMSMITMVNPITNIYFVRPYRNAVPEVFHGKLLRAASSRVSSLTGSRVSLSAKGPQQHSQQTASGTS
ncbi:hypothetical protein AAVH_28845 [Aphelenchoides avenae]|nr:hypothetical protein AAVH_28845 [Aphelenchus avenae]